MNEDAQQVHQPDRLLASRRFAPTGQQAAGCAKRYPLLLCALASLREISFSCAVCATWHP